MEHDSGNFRVAGNHRTKDDILVRKFPGKVLHVKDHHQHFHLTVSVISFVQNIAVGYHKRAFPGIHLLLLQPDHRPPTHHIVQFDLFMPVRTKIFSFAVPFIYK